MVMRNPVYIEQEKRAIELKLAWHNLTTQIAQRNHDIINGRLSKNMKPFNPAKPWGPRDHFRVSGYYTHNVEGYVPKPESLTVPSRPPPAERRAEDQPFVYVPKDPEDSRIRIDILAGCVYDSLSVARGGDFSMERRSCGQ